LPDVIVGTAPIGRETLHAIEADQLQQQPLSSTPDIRVELASLPSELAREIPVEEARRMQSLANASIPDHLVAPAGQRLTQPWPEAPADAKRAMDASRRARNQVPPDVTVRLDDADETVADAARTDPQPKRRTRMERDHRGDSDSTSRRPKP